MLYDIHQYVGSVAALPPTGESGELSQRCKSWLTSLRLLGFVLALLPPLHQSLDGTQDPGDGLLHLRGEPGAEDRFRTCSQETQDPTLSTESQCWEG